MSIGENTLDRVIRRFVVMATTIDGDHVIPANEPWPAPQGLYASVLRSTGDHMGTPDIRHKLSDDGEDVIATTRAWSRTFYSVNFYRDGAYEQANRLRIWCSSPLGIEQQRATNVLIPEHSHVRRIDEMFQEAPEERAQIDIHVDSTLVLTQNVGRVREVPFDARIGANEQSGEVS